MQSVANFIFFPKFVMEMLATAINFYAKTAV